MARILGWLPFPPPVDHILSELSAMTRLSLVALHSLTHSFIELHKPLRHDKAVIHEGDWNAKVGSQDIPGITGKFGLGEQNEAGQRLTEYCQENVLVIANTLFQQHRDDFTHGHHHMVNTEIRLIVFFAAKDGEALYSQKKQDLELTCGPDPY